MISITKSAIKAMKVSACELSFLLFDWLHIWFYICMLKWNNIDLLVSFPALQTCGPDCGEVYQKGEVKPIRIRTLFSFSSQKKSKFSRSVSLALIFAVQARVQGSWSVCGRFYCQTVETPVWCRQGCFRPKIHQKHYGNVWESLPLPSRGQGEDFFSQLSLLLCSRSPVWTSFFAVLLCRVRLCESWTCGRRMEFSR